MSGKKVFIKNPISEEALELIGFYDEDADRKPTDKVFPDFITFLRHCIAQNENQ